MTGLGTGRDPAKAAESYRKDAERGIPEAQTILGCLCESGSGVAKDPAKAAEGGFPPA
jgi:TPR repeat protein